MAIWRGGMTSALADGHSSFSAGLEAAYGSIIFTAKSKNIGLTGNIPGAPPYQKYGIGQPCLLSGGLSPEKKYASISGVFL